MKTFFIFTAVLLFSIPSYAFNTESSGETTMTIMDYIKDYVDVPEGATDWKVFGTTKEKEITTKSDDNYDYVYSKPEFQDAVKKLDGKEIKIKGYMFPLNEADNQNLFLFGPFPLTCPYQYHVGPSLVLEVHADSNPVKFDYEPVIITGTLELVSNDPENSIFYRLNNARQVK